MTNRLALRPPHLFAPAWVYRLWPIALGLAVASTAPPASAQLPPSPTQIKQQEAERKAAQSAQQAERARKDKERAEQDKARAEERAAKAEAELSALKNAQQAAKANAAASATSAPRAAAATEPHTPPAQALLHGRYQILGNGSEVKDVLTGLVWARCSVGQRWNGGICAGEAKTFTFDAAQKLEGSGWRVPNVRELASLIHCSSGKTRDRDDPKDGGGPTANYCHGDYTLPTTRSDAFPNTPDTWFWTSSPYAGSSKFAWDVNFGNGYVGRSYRNGNYAVRLVRASQ